MKKLMTLALLMTIAISTHAMSYSRARSQALFLTDKMGYELNLTDDQYNAVYEINLDYLMCISAQGDLFGDYWLRRNNELRYVLSAYQYERFIATEYFYRPISRVANAFSFLVYNHYPKHKFYRNAPTVYDTYKGGNRQYRYSPYQGRTYTNEPNRNIRQSQGGIPPQPGKSKSQAVKGARQQQGNVRTAPQGGNRQPQGNGSRSIQGSSRQTKGNTSTTRNRSTR